MREPIVFLMVVVGVTTVAEAQTVSLFGVSQPPQFQVDAGADVTYAPGLTLQAVATGGTSNYSYLWSPPEYMDDATSPTPTVLDLLGPTLFTVQVTDLGLGCTLTDEVLVDFNIGVAEWRDQALVVSPNPTDGLLRIQSPVAVQRMRLRAPNGALVMEQRSVPTRELVMDVSFLPAGLYYMTIECMDGRIHTHKLCSTSAH